MGEMFAMNTHIQCFVFFGLFVFHLLTSFSAIFGYISGRPFHAILKWGCSSPPSYYNFGVSHNLARRLTVHHCWDTAKGRTHDLPVNF